MGEKPAVKEILAGTFQYPEGTDPFTKAIMKEACEVFQHMSPKDLVVLVEAQDFQEYWLHAREITSSSHSGMHFGIYMANARSDKLSLLHAAKLSLAAKLCIMLDRWHNALTVLLEKSFGNIMIDKLRDICLLEADYNWLMKLIFAKRMMNNDQAHKAPPTVEKSPEALATEAMALTLAKHVAAASKDSPSISALLKSCPDLMKMSINGKKLLIEKAPLVPKKSAN
jgi:hypothetical protein